MSSSYLRTARERRQAILNDTNDRFYFVHQHVGNIQAFQNGIFEQGVNFGRYGHFSVQSNQLAGQTVRYLDDVIIRASIEFGIDADLVRAVIYTEVSRGASYGLLGELAGASHTILPGNIGSEWVIQVRSGEECEDSREIG